MLPLGEKQVKEAQLTHLAQPRCALACSSRAAGAGPDRRPPGQLPAVPGVLRPPQGPGQLGSKDVPFGASPRGRGALHGHVKERRRSILHVDLDPFFVSVERSLDPTLRGRPVVIGGDGSGMGFVAAASEEARQAGVRVGLPVSQARLLCPSGGFAAGTSTRTAGTARR